MTVLVTRDVATRFRGFLASCMLEIAPGVYTSPKMTPSVRQRVWEVMQGWFGELGGGSIVMTWLDRLAPGGQQVAVLGCPTYELMDHHGVFLARKRGPNLRAEE
jgi:CRISPR-associated protein Cas2